MANTLHLKATFGNKVNGVRKLKTIFDLEIPWCQRQGAHNKLYSDRMSNADSPLKNVWRDGSKAIGLPNGSWTTKKPKNPNDLKKLRSEFNYHMNRRK